MPSALNAYLASLPRLGLNALGVLALFAVGALAHAAWRGPRDGEAGGLLARAFPRRLFGHPSSRPERIQFVLYHLAFLPLLRSAMVAVFSVLSAGAVFAALSAALGGGAPLLTAHRPVVLFQIATFFLASEFAFYWTHRWCHTTQFLWAFHRVHHSAEALTPFTLPRGHPMDLVVNGFVRAVSAGVLSGLVLFLARTPVERSALIGYGLLGALLPFGLDAWRHSHIRLSLGPLDRVLTSPAVHQLHHSAETRHRDCNFGSDVMIFDWLFGTLILPRRDEVYRWGLNEDELGANNPHPRLRDFYLEPFAYLARRKRGTPSAPDRVARP